jgi:hypothetical protein
MKAGTQWAVGPERRFRHLAAMAADCPVCKKPMPQRGRTFQCEPWREIIIFFEVDPSAHRSWARDSGAAGALEL